MPKKKARRGRPPGSKTTVKRGRPPKLAAKAAPRGKRKVAKAAAQGPVASVSFDLGSFFAALGGMLETRLGQIAQELSNLVEAVEALGDDVPPGPAATAGLRDEAPAEEMLSGPGPDLS